MKPLRFIGNSLDALREFPREAQRQAGYELDQLQRGLMPSDWKSMGDVGKGVQEIRIHVEGEWRILYVARFSSAVYVLHCFQKKTQKTRQQDIELARERFKTIRGE